MSLKQTIGIGMTVLVLLSVVGVGLFAKAGEIEWKTFWSNEGRFSAVFPHSVPTEVPAPPNHEKRPDKTSEAAKKELALLQGRWKFIGAGGFTDTFALLVGQKDARQVLLNFDEYRLIVKGSEFQFGDGAPAGRTSATIDPTKNPKWIDFKDPTGRSWVGVYRLDGDKLLITVGYGNRRPRMVLDSVSEHLERGDACGNFTRITDEGKEHIPTDISEKLEGLNTTSENVSSNSVPNETDGERVATDPSRPNPPVEGFFEWMNGVDREFLSEYEKTDLWAAIAYSPTTGRYGTSSGVSRDTALRAAKDRCKTADARPVVLVGNGWCA